MEIVHHPADILRHVGTPIDVFDAALRAYAEQMAELMYLAPGVGLAANQVGDPRAFAVLDTEDGRDLRSIVNPRIVLREGRVSSNEGCLSLPGRHYAVPRSTSVVVEAQDLTGKPLRIAADGFLAIVLQHEIDHLEGRLIMDTGKLLKKR